MAGKPKYYDLRYMFMRGLQAHERMQRGKHYLKSAAECTSKAIVSLELSDKNINTAKQAARLQAIGPETGRLLEGYVQSQAYSSDRPAPGHYVSSAGAILVALLNLTEMASDNSESAVVLIGEEDLHKEAATLSDERFLPRQSPGFCQAWWRLEVLIKRYLVKRRSLHKANVYHLLPEGMELAAALRLRSLGQDGPKAGLARNPPVLSATTPPLLGASLTTPKSRKRRGAAETTTHPDEKKPSLPRLSVPAAATSSSSSLSTDTSASTEHPVEHVLTDAMYSNDTGEDGVVLLVDIQECGGNRAGLAELCEMIEQTGTVYRTRKLTCADYTWLWRCDGVERQLPFLLERKRADDVAFSLKDGCFWGQIAKMTSQKEEFVKKGLEARVQYVIEGKPENFLVHCADGCQGVGRCGNPTLLQVQRVLSDLKQHPQLELITVDSLLDTVRLLANTTTQLRHRVERGEFDAMVIAEMMAASLERAVTEEHHTASKIKAEQPVFVTDDDSSNDTGDFNHQRDEAKTDGKLNEKNGAGRTRNRSDHSASPRRKDASDDLPPLHPPAVSAPGARPSGLMGQGASRPAVQDERDGPLRLSTSSGSPRGRVYLMKRKGGQNSPGKNKSVMLEDCGASRRETRKEGGWKDRERSWGVETSSKRPSSPLSLREEAGGRRGKESSQQTAVAYGTSSPPRRSLFSQGTPGMCPGRSSSISGPASRNWPSLGRSSAASNCHSQGLRHNCGDASQIQGQDSATVNDNDPHPVNKNASAKAASGAAATAKDSHPRSAGSSSRASTLTANGISAARLRDDFSWVAKEAETGSPAAERWSGKKTVARASSGVQDGSDSEDSDSLPDLDLGVRPLRRQPPSPPSNALVAITGWPAGETTQWHRGSNSWDEESGGAPKHPRNDDTVVEPADKIAQIAAVFPQMKGSEIAEVLRRFDGSIERSVIAILEEEPGLMGKQPAPNVADPPTPSPLLPSATAASSRSASAVIDLTD